MRHEFNGRYNPDKFAAVESCLCKQTFPTFNKPIQNQERKKRRNFSTRFARLASRCARSKKEKSNKSCARPRSHGASSNDIKMESAVSEVNQNRVAWPGSKLSKPQQQNSNRIFSDADGIFIFSSAIAWMVFSVSFSSRREGIGGIEFRARLFGSMFRKGMPSGKKEVSSIAEKRISVLSLSKPVLAIVAEAGLDLELKLMPSCLHLRFLLLPACAHPLLVLSGLSMMKYFEI